MGAGSWARCPSALQPDCGIDRERARLGRCLVQRAGAVAALSALRMPVLLMTGSESPASSLGVARILAAQLARVETIEFQGLGHMGPVTHPERVNGAVERFLLLHHRDPAT
jgi:pimeloyl-ACP methyl ester carboxylesterase